MRCLGDPELLEVAILGEASRRRLGEKGERAELRREPRGEGGLKRESRSLDRTQQPS